jgi:hypothetical protein
MFQKVILIYIIFVYKLTLLKNLISISMEEKVNVWKANLTNGLILGLAGVAFSLVLYFLDLSLNRSAGYIYIPIQLILLFFLLKGYRDNFMHGQISYGQAVGAGVIIILYSSVIASIYTYVLFSIIDPGLVKKSLALAEEAMSKKGLPQAQIDAAMQFTAKFMKPVVMVISGFFASMFFGVIYTLLVAIFVKKEGNPLIDTPAN